MFFSLIINKNTPLTIQSTNQDAIIDATFYRGLYIWTHTANSHVTIDGITVRNGFVVKDIGAGALIRTQFGDITIRNSRFIDNRSSSFFFSSEASGAFFRVENTGRILLENNTFASNYAKGTAGGVGIMIPGFNSSVTLVNNIFNDNEASTKGDGGGGIYVRLYFDSASVVMSNNIIWSNTGGNGIGEDIYIEDDGNNNNTNAQADLYYNDFTKMYQRG